MKILKINIVFDFTDNPWGGGNQFLKALSQELIKKSFYTEDESGADIFLFNSHHSLKKVFKLKLK